MKRNFLLVLALLTFVPVLSLALDTATRSVSPVRSWSEADLATFDSDWLHFKCVEGCSPVQVGKILIDEDGRDLSPLNHLIAGASELRRTFPGPRQRYLEKKARGESAAGVTGPDLSLWFDLKVEGGRSRLASMIGELNSLDLIEIAHPAPICEPAAIFGETGDRSPDFTSMQDYLYDTPVGLDAPSAWAEWGGRGLGMKFIDVELGWVLDHEDFHPRMHFYQGGAPMDPGYYDHGTAVMGEVVGRSDGSGITGFASDARWGVVAITEDEWPDVPHYFQEAIDNLDAGDVWLIELQMYPPGRSATPMEWLQVNYDVIWTGCWAEGVVCVEAGANGSQNLDDSSWGGVFDRNVRDSGAIMVGAGTPTGRVAEYFTNWGSRMDVHAWGSSIVTTGYGDLYNGGSLQTEYTSSFGGTSGASPMVTGSALCLQGIARSFYGAPLSPEDLRALLHDTGVPHLDGDQEIGPRPDLGAAVEQLLSGSAVADLPQDESPRVRSLPNPFRESTEIRFQQARQGRAQLRIYDIGGRLVRSMSRESAAGENSLIWDGRDGRGHALGSGVYFFNLDAGGERREGRLVLIR